MFTIYGHTNVSDNNKLKWVILKNLNVIGCIKYIFYVKFTLLSLFNTDQVQNNRHFMRNFI